MMNKDTIMDATTSPELQLCPASPDAQELFRPTLSDVSSGNGNVQPITAIRPHHHQNPRKKRTKMIRIHNSKAAMLGVGGGDSGTHSGVIAKKKPDPSAPKITRPCTECGKRFWSWKALFGHMRCHPERPWRGINPPPNLHHMPTNLHHMPTNLHHHPPPDHDDFSRVTTEEDEYVAACLLTLANGPPLPDTTTATTSYNHHHHQHQPALQDTITDPESRFECSSCKKVFGSHQALGGHRASHKNVKGCFAITRNDGGTDELEDGEIASHCDRTGVGGGGDMMVVLGSSSNQQHRCSICLKIFSSGQALGGHKRCHWEKEDGLVTPQTHLKFRFDLNLPANQQQDDHHPPSDLDLRLTL